MTKIRYALFRIQQNLRQRLMPEHFLEHHPRIKRDLFLLIALESGKEDLRLFREVFNSRPPRTDLPPQEVVEYLDDVFAGFEFESVEVEQEVVQEIGVVGFLSELGYDFW